MNPVDYEKTNNKMMKLMISNPVVYERTEIFSIINDIFMFRVTYNH